MIGYFLEILELVQGTCPNSKTIDFWAGHVTGFGLRTGTLNQLQNFEKISDHRKNLKNVLFGTKTGSLSDKVVWERPNRAPQSRYPPWQIEDFGEISASGVIT